MGGTKDSMIAGAPRNLTRQEQLLVLRRPPEDDEPEPLPEPIPARVIPVTDAPTGARQFAAAAERAGYRVEVAASHGPLLNGKGTSTRMVDVVSVRCFRSAHDRATIVACWSGGSYEMAMGKRGDGSTRQAATLRQAKAWLEHGVEGDVPDARDVARFIVRTLGGRLIGVRHQHPVRHVCPVPQTDASATDHLVTVHRWNLLEAVVDPMADHAAAHANGGPKHTHERWPLGEPPDAAA